MVTRKLAAIVASDAVGYSRLMEVDAPGTLAALKRHRQQLDDIARAHGGRVVGMSGDSVLLEFPSVVDAVSCAIAAQGQIAAVNADLPDDRRMLFRIGVNLGDVLIDGDDIFGDGVNIAARLESLARPGGICISDEVWHLLPADLQARFEDQGERALKNIARPLRIWQWAEVRERAVATTGPDGQVRTRILVEPFASRGESGEQAHFAADLADDLTAVLSRLDAVVVVEDAGEPHDFTIAGSVRWAGERARITAYLTDEAEGTRVWTRQFDRKVDDIFAVEDEVAEAVVGSARMIIKMQEAKRLAARDESTLSVPELLARAAGILTSETGRNDEVRRLMERAVRLRPDNSMALAMLAMARARQSDEGATAYAADDIAAIEAEAREAVRLDPKSFFAQFALAVTQLNFLHRHRDALASAQRALEINPHLMSAQSLAGAVSALLGDVDAGIAAIEHSIEVERHNVQVERYHYELAVARFTNGDIAAAAEAAHRAMQRAADRPRNALLRAACLALTDRADEASPIIADLVRRTPGLTVQTAIAPPFVDPADLERYRDGLRRAGLPDG